MKYSPIIFLLFITVFVGCNESRPSYIEEIEIVKKETKDNILLKKYDDSKIKKHIVDSVIYFDNFKLQSDSNFNKYGLVEAYNDSDKEIVGIIFRVRGQNCQRDIQVVTSIKSKKRKILKFKIVDGCNQSLSLNPIEVVYSDATFHSKFDLSIQKNQ